MNCSDLLNELFVKELQKFPYISMVLTIHALTIYLCGKKCFNSIPKIIGCSAKRCQVQYKELRDHYCQERKKMKHSRTKRKRSNFGVSHMLKLPYTGCKSRIGL
ncbi:hypothetical protein X975_08462, partial [Stegodyphus mimosarum]